MRTEFITAAIGAAAVLTACGSGSVDGDAAAIDKLNGFVELGEKNLFSSEPIDEDDLPDTAEMSGYLASGSESDDSFIVVGTAKATADFSSGDLTGSVADLTEFEIPDSCDGVISGCEVSPILDFDGTLDIDGEISGVGFDFEVNGLVSADVDGSEIVADLTLEGDGVFGAVDGDLVATGIASGGTEIVTGNASGVDDLFGVLVLIED